MTLHFDVAPAELAARVPGFEIQATAAHVYVVGSRDGTPACVAALADEPFDTGIFGISVGRIPAAAAVLPEDFEPLYRAVDEQALARGYRYFTRRIGPLDRAESRALETTGYHLVDVGVTLDHDLRDVPRVPDPDVRAATSADVEHLAATCGGIFRTSRYYGEPLFAEDRAEELHRTWIRNCHRGRADVILTLVQSGEPVAFVTCAVDRQRIGDIALFGVGPAAQGRGVGARLLRAALAWFAERAERVHVKTQAINYRALRMYERGGFRQIRAELTYGRTLGART